MNTSIHISGSNKEHKLVSWLLFVLVVLAAGWLRLQLVDVPLERDEGEYAYGGQLLLQGVAPYMKLYNMKLPGIYLAYAAVVALFGQTQTGVHLGLLLVNSLSCLLIFLICRQIFTGRAAVGAVLFFALVSMGQPVQGLFANSEHFVLLPALLGTYILTSDRSQRFALLCLAGLCMGTAFIIKQHGIAYVLFGLCLVVAQGWMDRERRWSQLFRRALFFSIGAIIPYLLVCGWLTWAGAFDNFWFWTVTYARTYASQVPLAAAWFGLKTRIIGIGSAAPFLWLLVPLGALSLVTFRVLRANVMFVGLFTLFSFLALCPGFYFRPHYFIFFLPAAAFLLAALIAAAQKMKGGQWVVLGVVICAAIQGFYNQKGYLLERDTARLIRATYWPNPFSESLPIASFIEKRTEANDTIALIGSEPQIFFYAKRRSATGYIYMYPLMERHDFALEMQKRLIQEIEKVQPKIMVFVRIDLSWLQKRDSSTLIYEWFTEYKKDYHRVGLVEIFEQKSHYSWAPEVRWPPKTPYWIEILERNN